MTRPSGEGGPAWNAGAFLGLEGEACDPRGARFVVLPVPYEKTTTYRKGTARGPAAILDASLQVELFDERGWDEPYRAGITTRPPFAFEGPPERLADALEPVIGSLLEEGRVPVVLGGEHSLSLGPIRASARRFPSLGVLHVDAHGDLREAYEGTRYGHGCVMRRVLDAGVPIVQVGVRSLSAEEAATVVRALPGRAEPPKGGAVLTFFAHDLPRFGPGLPGTLVSALPEAVYLSIDLDGLDASLFPSVGTPEPGGLSWDSLLSIVEAVAAERRIVALDVVELLPIEGLHAPDFAAARLVYRAIGAIARAPA